MPDLTIVTRQDPSITSLDSPPDVDVARVAQALTHDIELASARRTRPGWTPWALLAAGAAAAWGLLTTLESGAPDWTRVGRWSVLLIASADAIAWLRGLLNRSSHRRAKSHRFYVTSDALAGNRFSLVYVIIHSAVMFGLIIEWRSSMPALFVYTALPYYALGAVFSLGAFVVSFVGLPIAAEHPSSRAARVTHVAMFVLVSLILLGIAEAAYLDRSILEPRSVKLAGLVLTMQLVAELLSTSTSEPPLIATLLDIRRRVLLGETTPRVAVAEIEIATLGLRASDVLQTHIRKLLQMQEEMRSHLRSGIDDLSRLKSLLSKSGALTNEEAAAAQRAIEATVREHGDRARAVLRSYELASKELRTRVAWLSSVSVQHKATVDPVLSKLQEGFETVRADLTRFTEATLSASASAGYTSATSPDVPARHSAGDSP